MDTHSRIQELANNSEIENSRTKGRTKFFKFTVSFFGQYMYYADFHVPFNLRHNTTFSQICLLAKLLLCIQRKRQIVITKLKATGFIVNAGLKTRVKHHN